MNSNNFIHENVIYTAPSTWSTSNLESVISDEIKEKTDYLLRIWEKICVPVNPGKQVEVRDKILDHLSNLIDDAFLEEDLKIPVPEEHTNYAEPDYSKSFVNTHFERAVAEKEQKEKENAEFIEFVKDLMRIAETNRQRNF